MDPGERVRTYASFLAACALLEGLLVHPASHGHIDPAHELIVVNCTTVKFFTAC